MYTLAHTCTHLHTLLLIYEMLHYVIIVKRLICYSITLVYAYTSKYSSSESCAHVETLMHGLVAYGETI